MNWKSYLQTQTRNPQFLWRVVLAILAAGGVTAIAVDYFRDAPIVRAGPQDPREIPQRPEDSEPRDISSLAELQRAINNRDWWAVWWLLPVVAWLDVDLGPTIIAGLTGLFWFIFLLQSGHVESLRSTRILLCGAALVLGALSTWPTLFVSVLQDEASRFAWQPRDGLTAGLRYFVLGVGLREELIKLLFFVPLVPVVVWRRNELERLVVASCVGLGFAAEENISYLTSSVSTASVGRYLTANFFHLAATGLAGLWLCRAIRWPKECVPQFLAYFCLLVLAHGLYDAFIIVPELVEVSLLGMIIFIVLAYLYFHELRELRPVRREVVSLTANFVIGLSLLAAVTFVYVTAQLGLRLAGDAFVAPAVSTSLMAYIFLREVPESLVRR